MHAASMPASDLKQGIAWRMRPAAHLSVGGSMRPGDSACARSGAPTVSAMRAVPAPVTDTMSPAPAAAMSTRPVPRRFQILVSRASSGARLAHAQASHVPSHWVSQIHLALLLPAFLGTMLVSTRQRMQSSPASAGCCEAARDACVLQTSDTFTSACSSE